MAYDPTLPAGSTLGKSFEYGVDIDLNAFGITPATWQSVRRMFNFVPTMTPITQDAATYDDKGSPNSDVSAWSFSLAFSVYVNHSATTGALPPELAALFTRYGDKIGNDAVAHVRWYHKPGDGSTPDPTDAFEGNVTVAIVRGNTGPDGTNEMWNVTLTGKGYATRITNPFTGWATGATAPVITTVTPAGRSVGELVTINGSGFLGATGVSIDAVAVTADNFTIVSSSTIVATIPATAAGASDVTVTTPAGTSNAVSYTVV